MDSPNSAESASPAKLDDARNNGRFDVASRLRRLLYLNCVLTDFAFFLIIFITSRGLADREVDSSYLGIMGAGLSFTAGLGSILGGWLASRFDGRSVFVFGAVSAVAGIMACSRLDPMSAAYLPAYWSLGISLGSIYPPLIGWLNHGADVIGDPRGVSRRLIIFCVAWNTGMMIGQLSGGELYQMGDKWEWSALLPGVQPTRTHFEEPGGKWVWNVALIAACLNVAVAIAAVSFVSRLPSVVHFVMGSAASPPAPPSARLFKGLGWIANLGGVFGGSLIIHLLPDLMVDLEVSPEDHGQMLAVWRCVIIATYLAMHFATFWRYCFGVSVASQLLGALGLIGIGLAETPALLLMALALHGQLVGFNYFSSLFYSTAGAAQESRAFAAGIHEATLATGMALGTIAGGYIGSLIDNRLPYHLSAAVIGVLLVWQWVVWKFSERGASAP